MSLDLTLMEDVYSGNITHNLGNMASECGLYEPMWRPYKLLGLKEEDEDDAFIEAKSIIPHLEKGIEELAAHPEKYKEFNPENGWGDYDGLLRVARKYLAHCQVYPDSRVRTSR